MPEALIQSHLGARRTLRALMLALAAAACQVGPAPATATASPAPAPTGTTAQTPTFPPTATATERPTETPSPTPQCSETRGTVEVTELIDSDLPRSLPYRIYLPPCAERWRGRLPAIYLLHGLAYTDSQWDDLGIDEMADRWIRLGLAEPFLIVMPWERLGLEFEPTIIDYLLPHIEGEYGASVDPGKRAIGGISRGGGWALRIGLAHADQFSAIGLHSPAIQGTDLINLPRWLEAGPAPALWIDMGRRDPLRSSVTQLTEALDSLDVEYRFLLFDGEHAPGYWAQHVDEYLRWYVSNWD